jgi:hypothetical protein
VHSSKIQEPSTVEIKLEWPQVGKSGLVDSA